MFLSKIALERVLLKALETGGDFAEVFLENTDGFSINMIDDKIDDVSNNKNCGAGIRILKGSGSVYATTNDITEKGLLLCASKAALSIKKSDALKSEIYLVEKIPVNFSPIEKLFSDLPAKAKLDIVRETYEIIKNYSTEIIQAAVGIMSRDQSVLIANSDGLYVKDRRIYTRAGLSAIASNGKENQVGFEGPGAMMGMEVFEKTIDLKEYAKEAAKTAVTMLHADHCPAGKMPVAIENGFGGVIFHEACGHSLEATSVAKGNSEFAGKLGQQIANKKITAIDDGTLKNEWGSVNIDDEGRNSQRNVLIENGILKGYLIDKLGARRMGMKETGSARRQSYQYAPTSRMTNTFIQNGEDKNEDIIASIEDGLYAKKMGGGSVNPETGEFNFSVAEGYLVKNGKITKPVRGASLIGKGSQILKDIDMVGQNLKLGAGMCGSESGSIPVNVGQPLLRVSSINIGGR